LHLVGCLYFYICDYLCCCADCDDVHESDEVEKNSVNVITAAKPDIMFKTPKALWNAFWISFELRPFHSQID